MSHLVEMPRIPRHACRVGGKRSKVSSYSEHIAGAIQIAGKRPLTRYKSDFIADATSGTSSNHTLQAIKSLAIDIAVVLLTCSTSDCIAALLHGMPDPNFFHGLMAKQDPSQSDSLRAKQRIAHCEQCQRGPMQPKYKAHVATPDAQIRGTICKKP